MKYLCISLLLFRSLAAYPVCSFDLKYALEAIYSFPEGRKLIEQVEQEGSITIYRSEFPGDSRAMWLSSTREIILNKNFYSSYGDQVRSILFELHNAKMDEKFRTLDKLARQLSVSKYEYTEMVERLEHQNALTVCKLLDKGIYLGYFPASSRWSMPLDFNHYFEIQKKSGHSGEIAAFYEAIMGHHAYS